MARSKAWLISHWPIANSRYYLAMLKAVCTTAWFISSFGCWKMAERTMEIQWSLIGMDIE